MVLKAGVNRPEADIAGELVGLVRERIGPVASFRDARVVARLPKTRSGKILRATIRKIADGEDYVAPATIEDPAVLAEIGHGAGALRSASMAGLIGRPALSSRGPSSRIRMRRLALRLAALAILVGALPPPALAQAAGKKAAAPAAAPAQGAPGQPPHAWLFGTWTGGIFPPPSHVTAEACLSQPVVIFTRDVVLRATLTDQFYIQRLVATALTTPRGTQFQFSCRRPLDVAARTGGGDGARHGVRLREPRPARRGAPHRQPDHLPRLLGLPLSADPLSRPLRKNSEERSMSQTVARLLVDSLEAHDIDLIYCVPGESYLGLTNALVDNNRLRLIVCRHESGASFMAAADGRMRGGRAGVCVVSRGPGLSNGLIGLHTAYHDATPMVMLIGQVERRDFGRLALQEQNYSRLLSDITKLVIEVNEPEMASEAIARAFHIAESGTPGPVAVILPEDLFEEQTEAPLDRPRPAALAGPRAADLDQLAGMLERAERPLVWVGGALRDAAVPELVQLAERWMLPISPTHRRPHLFDADHPNYGGYMGTRVPRELLDAMKRADLLVALGERLSDSVSQSVQLSHAPPSRNCRWSISGRTPTRSAACSAPSSAWPATRKR